MQKFDEMVDGLKTERDELKLRLHLMKAEIRDEWDELDGQWEQLQQKLRPLKRSASESADDIGAATRQLAEEIGNAYRRIKKSLE